VNVQTGPIMGEGDHPSYTGAKRREGRGHPDDRQAECEARRREWGEHVREIRIAVLAIHA